MRDYLLGLYEKSMPDFLTVEEKLTAAGRAGYDYLELSIDESGAKRQRLDWDAAQVRDLCRAQLDTGVPIKSICLSAQRKFPLGHPDPSVRRESLRILERAVALAAALGVRIIQLAGYDVYYLPSTGETRAHFAHGLARAVSIAAREGVLLAFETMETPFLDTVSKAMSWVEQISSPYLQIYPDAGNLTNAAAGDSAVVTADLDRGRGHLAALHLKESRPGIYREVPYGAGWVDFSAVAARARALGVGLFVGEFWHLGEADWPEVLARNRAFLSAALQGPSGE